ncbi:hypothetical protein KLNKPBOH_01164 [Aeromonas veronii]
MWQQCLLTLKPRSRGFHLVTDELVAKLPMLADYRIGMAHLLLQHTSASASAHPQRELRSECAQRYGGPSAPAGAGRCPLLSPHL